MSDDDRRPAIDVDVEEHRLDLNDRETDIDDAPSTRDVEGHRLASNDDETVIED